MADDDIAKRRRAKDPTAALEEKLGPPPEEDPPKDLAAEGTHDRGIDPGSTTTLMGDDRPIVIRGDNDPSIVQLLVEILGELPSIGKEGTAPEGMGGYSFRKIDDILNEANPLLAKKGVLPVPTVLKRVGEERQTRNGTALYVVHLKVRYRFYGAPRGDYLDAVVWGEGMDNFDKATNKAMTTAFKNALIQVFAIATGEPDPDSGEHEETVGSRRPRSGGNSGGQKRGPSDAAKKAAAKTEMKDLGWEDGEEGLRLHVSLGSRIRDLGEANADDKALIAEFREEAKLPWPMGPDDWAKLDEFIETLEGPGPDDEGNAEDPDVPTDPSASG